MTSGEFGFERDVIEKATIDRIAVPPFDGFTPEERRKANDLFALLDKNAEDGWNEVDMWISRLYGLTSRDLDVISDTLKYSLPFSDNKKSAENEPSDAAVRQFCSTLNAELEAWGSRFGKQLVAEPTSLPNISPWRTLRLRIANAFQNGNAGPDRSWFEFFKVADHLAASEVIFENSDENCIWIGRLDQARYWTPTRARLVARQMIWEHAEFLASGAE